MEEIKAPIRAKVLRQTRKLEEVSEFNAHFGNC